MVQQRKLGPNRQIISNRLLVAWGLVNQKSSNRFPIDDDGSEIRKVKLWRVFGDNRSLVIDEKETKNPCFLGVS